MDSKRRRPQRHLNDRVPRDIITSTLRFGLDPYLVWQCRFFRWTQETEKTGILGTIDNIVVYTLYAGLSIDNQDHAFLPMFFPRSLNPAKDVPPMAVSYLREIRLKLMKIHQKDWDDYFDLRIKEAQLEMKGHPIVQYLTNDLLTYKECFSLTYRTFYRYMMTELSNRVKICEIRFPGLSYNELGIRAQVEIPRSTFLWELNGILSSDTYDEDAVSLIQAHSSQGLKGGPRFLAGAARFCNHSCTSNSLLYAVQERPAFVIQVIKDIKPGEEITVSYGRDYWKDKQCLCAHCTSSSAISI